MSVSYNVYTLALTTARDSKDYKLGARYLIVNRCDGPFWVSFGTGLPALRIDSKGTFEICKPGAEIPSTMFITNDVGSGTVELVVTNDVRADFSGSGAASDGESVAKIHAVPGHATNSIYGTDTVTGQATPESTVTGSIGEATTPYPIVSPDLGTCWQYNTVGSHSGADIEAKAKLRAANARYFSPPIHTLLNLGSKSIVGMGWWETETEVVIHPEPGNDYVFRFGFGDSDMSSVFANAYDVCVGFAAGVCDSLANREACFGGITTSETQLAAVIVSNGDNGGTPGGGRVVHYANDLGAYANDVAVRLKVRVGEVGGVPTVEWYVNDVLADRVEGALASTFEANIGGSTVIVAEPYIMLGLGNGGDPQLWWGYGRGWLARQYRDD